MPRWGEGVYFRFVKRFTGRPGNVILRENALGALRQFIMTSRHAAGSPLRDKEGERIHDFNYFSYFALLL